MIRRVVVVLAATMLTVSIAVSASSQPLPEHPHVLVLGVEFDEVTEEPLGYKACIDLANNKALKLTAQHAHMHFGRAGEALARNGNIVAPTAPFPGVPWSNCEELIAFFFGE